MSPEQQQIKIAEACGWKWIWESPPAYVWRLYKPSNGGIYYSDLDPDADYPVHVLPDYLNDLNAMHEAEKCLRRPMGANDNDGIIAERMHDYVERLGYCIDATAEQRAEAFLRTLGLWEGGE